MITKQEKLLQQKKYLAKVSGVLEPLRRSVNELESEISKEKMQKYIGKYYLYKNSSGSGAKWNLYVKPIEVINGFQVRVLIAQNAGYMSEIKLEDTSGDHLFQNEITKEEYDKGFNAILNEIIGVK